MKKIPKCPICGDEVTKKYFVFPKLPRNSPFSSLFGPIHVSCLRSHPKKIEIQNELKNTYLTIFENHPDFPIVAHFNYVLIKSRPDSGLFEIYDFEDFAEFYVPYQQVEDVMKMNSNQELGLGANKWTRLTVDNNELLTISYYLPKINCTDNIDLPHLKLNQLKKLLLEANSVTHNLELEQSKTQNRRQASK